MAAGYSLHNLRKEIRVHNEEENKSPLLSELKGEEGRPQSSCSLLDYA